jgi:phosphoglycerate kinase
VDFPPDRIRRKSATTRYRGGVALTSRKGRLGHLANPGARKAPEAKYALKRWPSAARAAQAAGGFVGDCVGGEVEDAAMMLVNGGFLLLENLRFHAGEEKNDPEFARQLAACAELYVNDAFGTAHRAHASTVGVTQFLQPAAAGFLMEKELRYRTGFRSGRSGPSGR